jgi:hypothetical protein
VLVEELDRKEYCELVTIAYFIHFVHTKKRLRKPLFKNGAGKESPFCSDKKPVRYTQEATLTCFRLTPFSSHYPEKPKDPVNLDLLVLLSG